MKITLTPAKQCKFIKLINGNFIYFISDGKGWFKVIVKAFDYEYKKFAIWSSYSSPYLGDCSFEINHLLNAL